MLEPIKWSGGKSTHHVWGSYHMAHSGDCLTNGSISYSSLGLRQRDCTMPIVEAGEDGRCDWCRAADEAKERSIGLT